MLINEVMYSSHEEWMTLRKPNIGASDVASLFGVQRPYQHSLWSLWQCKQGRIDDPSLGNKRTRAGLALEDAIVSLAVEDQGWHSYRRGGYVKHPTVPRFAASIDFFILDPEYNEIAIAEAKNIDYLVFKDIWDNDEPPEHILLQAQAQMACTGMEACWVCGLVGGNDPRQYLVERRSQLIAAIEREVRAFWRSVDEGKEPKVDGSQSTADALRKVYHPAPGAVFAADGSEGLLTLLGELKLARAEVNDAMHHQREVMNYIYGIIGDAELITLGGDVIATAKVSNRKGYEVSPAGVRQIRIKES